MKSILIVFSVIVLTNAKPTDYLEQYDDDASSASVSDESDAIITNYPIGVLTKNSDNPLDSYATSIVYDAPLEEIRIRRQSDCNETDQSIDVLTKEANKTVDVKRLERKIEDQQAKVPLRGFITAIESDLVSRALLANSQLRRRRSTERIVDDDDHEDDDDDDDDDDDEYDKESINGQNSNSTNDYVDVNKNFFEGLFNYTRPQRETEDKDLKIPLNDLVQAVETTIINSAQTLKERNPSKRETSIEETFKDDNANVTQRLPRDTSSSEQNTKKDAEIKVEKIASTNTVDLNLLSPIAFKSSPVVSTTTRDSNEDETTSTTEFPIQKTNLTIFAISNSLSLVPGADKKLAHVQHQAISQTVFHSNLAIFPTISPHSINVPLPQIITTEEPIETTILPKTTTGKTEQDLKNQLLLKKAQQLKEKFAEIQAEPVILTQI